MANLSNIKREALLKQIDEFRKINSSESSLKFLNEVQDLLTRKKYGLIFEEHTEEIDDLLINYIPVVKNDENREIITDKSKPVNFIIEGDNLHSLLTLEKTHINSIDCIYIDPPYNTGSKDWKYNNDYIDKLDTYRHSKWLSMMNRRLSIAKKLLKDDGVLICAIDENELATVTLLLQDVFGNNYHIDTICVIHNPRGVQGDNFSYTNEYALFVYKKGLKAIENQTLEMDKIDWSPLRNWGSESTRYDAANCFYPIFVKDNKIIGFGDDVTSKTDFHPKQTEFDKKTGIYSIYPIDIKGVERKWRFARQSVEKIFNLLRVKQTSTGFDIELGKDYAPYKTVWDDKKFDANEYGTKLINDMVPTNDFDFPKSLYNVLECLKAVLKNKPNATVLDFFAGSGTTGHAVLLMNKIFGGNRKFILCTNNDVGFKKEKEFIKSHPNLVINGQINKKSPEFIEYQQKYGIASSVTFPRIKSAILGYKSSAGVKTILYEKKVSSKMLFDVKKMKIISDDIEKIIKNNKYDEYKTVLEEETIRLFGLKNKNTNVSGLGGNVKYYICDWTERYPDGYLSNNLLMNSKTLIELQNFSIVDQKNNILVLNKDDFKKIDFKHPELINKVWLSQNIVFNSEDIKKIKKLNVKYIPKEFFSKELKEVGE